MTQVPSAPAGVDVSRPAPARIYDYMLRGSNHFQSDVEAAQRILSAVPEIQDCAWSNRGFHQRAAKWIAQQGVTQFVDIGSGLPTVGNTHEVVQKVNPHARVVYIDNDPMVAEQGGPLLAGDSSTRVICADLRDPDSILDHPSLRELIDFSRPVGLLLTAVLMFAADSSAPWDLVARYTGALVPGSYLALSHLTDDYKPPVTTERFRAVFDNATEQMHFRSREAIGRFFTGLEIIPPYDGAQATLCYTGIWGAEDPVLADSDGARWLYCAVARKP
ncbi:MAG TPA: SAM-dependent methyltransferase [Streptosporangiaceae bacterium]|nr:SAM-dependent methyltransferase [Streptosporangiaceae bacterium]